MPSELEVLREELRKMELELKQEREANAVHQAELTVAKEALAMEKQKFKKLWIESSVSNYRHMKSYRIRKMAKYVPLRQNLYSMPLLVQYSRITQLRAHFRQGPYKPLARMWYAREVNCTSRQGSPMDVFAGENPDILWEDWLPT